MLSHLGIGARPRGGVSRTTVHGDGTLRTNREGASPEQIAALFLSALEAPSHGVAEEVARELAALAPDLPRRERGLILALFHQGFRLIGDVITDLSLLSSEDLARLARDGTVEHLTDSAKALRDHHRIIHREYSTPGSHEEVRVDLRRRITNASARLSETVSELEFRAVQDDTSRLVAECEQLPHLTLPLRKGPLRVAPEDFLTALPAPLQTAFLIILTTARTRLHQRAIARILRSPFRQEALSHALCYTLLQGHSPHLILELIRAIPESHPDAHALLSHLRAGNRVPAHLREAIEDLAELLDDSRVAWSG